MTTWLRGWAVTLHIMIFERDTYRQLRDWRTDSLEDDFVDVPPPETYR